MTSTPSTPTALIGFDYVPAKGKGSPLRFEIGEPVVGAPASKVKSWIASGIVTTPAATPEDTDA